MWLITFVLCGLTAEALIETYTQGRKGFKSPIQCVDDEAETASTTALIATRPARALRSSMSWSNTMSGNGRGHQTDKNYANHAHHSWYLGWHDACEPLPDGT
eukprot:7689261-Lingulodinium_polyedra.AAC.1